MKLHTRISSCISLLWQFIKVSLQLIYGVWRISKLNKPIVTIFGGAQLKKNDFYSKQAHALGAMLIKEGISVVTGGGPGVMEAVSCGAYIERRDKAKIIGIGVKDLRESLNEPQNLCMDEYLELNYFFARKWLLTNYSQAMIVFPGGFGTLNELSEVLMLIQTKKLSPVPIVLIGTEFWEKFIMWVKGEALEHGLISIVDIGLFTLTDDLDFAFCIARDYCKMPSK